MAKKAKALSNRDRLNVFLLLLLRDYVPMGPVERILATVDSLSSADTGTDGFHNENFHAYIRDVSTRLWKEE